MRLLALLLVLLPLAAFGQAQTVMRDGVTLSQGQETRAERLGDQFRCLVCQNESIEDSGADLARQLRVIIRQKIVDGDSDRMIRDFLVRRYGIFVLLKPPVEPLTWPLYAMPVLAVLGGAGIVYLLWRRKAVASAPPLSPEEREQLRKLLDRR